MKLYFWFPAAPAVGATAAKAVLGELAADDDEDELGNEQDARDDDGEPNANAQVEGARVGGGVDGGKGWGGEEEGEVRARGPQSELVHSNAAITVHATA